MKMIFKFAVTICLSLTFFAFLNRNVSAGFRDTDEDLTIDDYLQAYGADQELSDQTKQTDYDYYWIEITLKDDDGDDNNYVNCWLEETVLSGPFWDRTYKNISSPYDVIEVGESRYIDNLLDKSKGDDVKLNLDNNDKTYSQRARVKGSYNVK